MLKSDSAPNYVLYGNASSIEYQYAKFILATNCQNAEIKGMLSSEFQKLKHEMKKTHSKAPYHHFTKDFLLLKGHTFTALDDIKTFTDVCPIDLKSIASENLYKLLKEIKNPIVEIEMKISDIVQDKIVIQVKIKVNSSYLITLLQKLFLNSWNLFLVKLVAYPRFLSPIKIPKSIEF